MEHDDVDETSSQASSSFLKLATHCPSALNRQPEKEPFPAELLSKLESMGWSPDAEEFQKKPAKPAMEWEEHDKTPPRAGRTPTKKPWREDFGEPHTWTLKPGERSSQGMDFNLGAAGSSHVMHQDYSCTADF
jgi:hypothetical protein